jgi:hypothetical protein
VSLASKVLMTGLNADPIGIFSKVLKKIVEILLLKLKIILQARLTITANLFHLSESDK